MGTRPATDGAPPDGGAQAGAMGGGPNAALDSALADYLVANRGSATWIVAVSGAQQAAQLELQTGLPVMAMGGWSGSDAALSLDQLKADIAAGTLRYVILGGRGGQGGSSSEVTSWITSHATVVSVAGSSVTLYDLVDALSS